MVFVIWVNVLFSSATRHYITRGAPRTWTALETCSKTPLAFSVTSPADGRVVPVVVVEVVEPAVNGVLTSRVWVADEGGAVPYV